jgi:hypothetical protein
VLSITCIPIDLMVRTVLAMSTSMPCMAVVPMIDRSTHGVPARGDTLRAWVRVVDYGLCTAVLRLNTSWRTVPVSAESRVKRPLQVVCFQI